MRCPFILISGISLFSLCTSPLYAETKKNNQHQPVVTSTDKNWLKPVVTHKQGKPVIIPVDYKYEPNTRGKTDLTRIVTGGTRGHNSTQNSVRIAVLTPEHTGLTSTESPTLYWFISEIVEQPLELTITHRQSVNPVLEIRLDNPTQTGIQVIKLTDYLLRLQPEVEYQWCIRMINHSKKEPQNLDLVSFGSILYRQVSGEQSQQWQQASPGALPALYAEKGYWYDALTAISRLIDRYPEHQTAYKQRTSLLEQAHLDEIMTSGM